MAVIVLNLIDQLSMEEIKSFYMVIYHLMLQMLADGLLHVPQILLELDHQLL